jgi:hypothetical protein
MPVDPLSTLVISSAANRILHLVEWDKVLHGLASDTAKTGVKSLFGRLKPSEQEKTAKIAITLFLHEWDNELEDKAPFAGALPGYRDQVRRLLRYSAPDIVECFKPDAEVDLGPVKRTWEELTRSPNPKQKFDSLPEGFDWTLVAQNYARAIRKQVKQDAELRAMLLAALQERVTEATERLAGPDPGFDIEGYREYLRKRCGALHLAVMHTSAHHFDRQITLWSVFVPPAARDSAPALDKPEEIRLRLREEGQLTADDASKIPALQKSYQAALVRPVLEMLDRERLSVVLGNPGSGKTSLLKYRALRWVNENQGALPLFIDLREYIREREGVPEYFETGCAYYRLDARQLDKHLKEGSAILFFDGLDEVFEPSMRSSVISEIAALVSRYPKAGVVVTSRIVGYEAERLQAAGFAHAALQDFDDTQVKDFLSRWHAIAEDDPNERTRLQSRIERAISESAAIRELAGNPLLLTMMAILNRNQELPRDRVELYREASRVLLHEWDASRALPVDEFARQEKEALLRQLAVDMQQLPGGLAGNLIDRDRLLERFRKFLAGIGIQDSYQKALSLVDQLTKRNFILSYAGADRFSFVHRTFLEYYCAAGFIERFEKKQELTLEQLKTEVFGKHWQDEKWREVLRLIAGMLDEKKAEEIILYLMSLDGSKDGYRNLFLAAWCLSEVRNRRAVQTTSDALFQEFTDRTIRLKGTEIDLSNLFSVEDLGRSALSCVARVWRAETARPWLQSLALESTSQLQRAGEIFEFVVKNSLWQAAIHELATNWKDEPDTLPWIKGLASGRDPVLREAAVKELALTWRDEPDTLPLLKLRAQSDPSVQVREVSVEQLGRGWRSDPEVPFILKERLRVDATSVRKKAALELAAGWKDDPTYSRISRTWSIRDAMLMNGDKH